jgi:hypothetical protein
MSNGAKIFVVIPTRNDAWILSRVLATTSLWADRIIVADENSWDETSNICRQFSKVQLITFEPKEFNESNRRQVLLQAVRQWDGQNLIFGLDADEIMTGEILQPSVMNEFVNQMKPGMSAQFQWIMLWGNCRQYRYDPTPEWSANYKYFAYWDDRQLKFDNVRMHSSRVPESSLSDSITFNKFRVLHFAFAEWQRMLAKHVYYLALERAMGSPKHAYSLNRKYRWFYKQPKSGPVISDIPKQWLEGYVHNGLDVSADIKQEDLYWYETEVLRFFNKYGLHKFRHLNIWGTNWEAKRKLALQKGEKEIFQAVIKNQQPWYDRIYYNYFQDFFDSGGKADSLVHIFK